MIYTKDENDDTKVIKRLGSGLSSFLVIYSFLTAVFGLTLFQVNSSFLFFLKQLKGQKSLGKEVARVSAWFNKILSWMDNLVAQ